MKKRVRPKPQLEKVKATTLRIIGGKMRGQKVRYNGNRNTRPMRDSVRENLFNILGQQVSGSIVVDPFCGTGILVAEAYSRGAVSAVAMDFDRRAIIQIQSNLERLDLLQNTVIAPGDAFRGLGSLLKELPTDIPWTVFLCPPYEMFNSRLEDLNRMIRFIASLHNQGTVIAESDNHFETELLTEGQWDIRRYGVTQLALAPLNSIQAEHSQCSPPE